VIVAGFAGVIMRVSAEVDGPCQLLVKHAKKAEQELAERQQQVEALTRELEALKASEGAGPATGATGKIMRRSALQAKRPHASDVFALGMASGCASIGRPPGGPGAGEGVPSRG
jgi:hypothetical protein